MSEFHQWIIIISEKVLFQILKKFDKTPIALELFIEQQGYHIMVRQISSALFKELPNLLVSSIICPFSLVIDLTVIRSGGQQLLFSLCPSFN